MRNESLPESVHKSKKMILNHQIISIIDVLCMVYHRKMKNNKSIKNNLTYTIVISY